MLGINPFTVLGDVRGKHEFADFAICIFRIFHRYSPFCGLTTAWCSISYMEHKKPGSRNTGFKSLIEQTIKAKIGRISENNSECSKNALQI